MSVIKILIKQYIDSIRIDENFEEEYLENIPAIQAMKNFSFSCPVTFFVGENGTGKSTLLEAIAIKCGFNAEGGTRNMSFSTNATHSLLYKNLKVIRNVPFPSDGFFLRSESFYNMGTEIDRLDKIGLYGETTGHNFIEENYGGRSMHKQSHGESFLSLALSRFGNKSIFFLDEPEAALSITSQMSFLVLMHDLVEQDCQFIIATHSPILTAYPNAEIIEFSGSGADPISYKESDIYILTKKFLNDTDVMLRKLLD